MAAPLIPDSGAKTLDRIGRIAGLAALFVAIFAILYFWLLYVMTD